MRTLLACLSFLAALLPAHAQETNAPPPAVARPRVTIAIVRDGPSWYSDTLAALTRSELQALVRDEFDVVFNQGPAFDANWDVAAVPGALAAALADPDVEIVLTMGVLATAEASHGTNVLAKPVIGGYVLDADTLQLPYDAEGRSTKTNFSFVVTPLRSTRDLETFHEMIGFAKVHCLVDEKLIEGLGSLKDTVRHFEEKLGFDIEFIPMGVLAAETLARIGPDVEALYLTPPLRMPPEEQDKLVASLNARKLPVFALTGYPAVEHGALAGLAPDTTFRLARRIALNLQQVMLGTSPNTLTVNMPVEEKLTINGRTAVQIGYFPSFETMLRAEILFADAFEQGRDLTLEQAMLMAVEGNPALDIAREEVAAGAALRRKARSALLPQAEAGADYYQIDEDRAEAAQGFEREARTAVGGEVAQVIFDDSVWSRLKAAGLDVERRKFEEDVRRLDIAADAGKRYLGYLSARALYRIEIDNLKLTQSNLELARLRYNVGSAGVEDVYRWEAEEARRRAAVIDAETHAHQAVDLLNQALGVAKTNEWKLQEIELGDRDYYFLGDRLTSLIGTEADLEALRDFGVAEALAQSPSLKALDAAIAAQRVRLDAFKRRGYLPSVGARFSYDHVLDEVRPGAQPPIDDEEWLAAFEASLPVFEGGGRQADVAQAATDLRRLAALREQARQLTELQARSALHALRSSQPSIRLSRVAADRSRKNLDVVKDKYARGSISIVNLLDAQTQARVQAQTAAIAVYQYLSDLIDYQRALGWMEVFKTDAEKDAWVGRFRSYAAGRQPTP
jgi:outer membrane protein